MAAAPHSGETDVFYEIVQSNRLFQGDCMER
jgi:hypothetical protein